MALHVIPQLFSGCPQTVHRLSADSPRGILPETNFDFLAAATRTKAALAHPRLFYPVHRLSIACPQTVRGGSCPKQILIFLPRPLSKFQRKTANIRSQNIADMKGMDGLMDRQQKKRAYKHFFTPKNKFVKDTQQIPREKQQTK